MRGICAVQLTQGRGVEFEQQGVFCEESALYICLKLTIMVYNRYMPDARMKITADLPAEEVKEEEEEEKEEEKPESIWKFYFQPRWQTALTTHFLFAVIYLVLFYVSNIWTAIKFAFYTLFGSASMLGPVFAFWGVVFEISVVIPFVGAWYAIFLLPLIWRSHYTKVQKIFLTAILVIVFILAVVITDTIARYALESEIISEFANFHDITL